MSAPRKSFYFVIVLNLLSLNNIIIIIIYFLLLIPVNFVSGGLTVITSYVKTVCEKKIEGTTGKKCAYHVARILHRHNI